jgi:hypothetical protein
MGAGAGELGTRGQFSVEQTYEANSAILESVCCSLLPANRFPLRSAICLLLTLLFAIPAMAEEPAGTSEEDGVGGDDAVDALPYLVATKSHFWTAASPE